jgi:hypothetical protein
MAVSLVVTEQLHNELQCAAEFHKETAGVMLVGIGEAPNGDVRVLGRDMRWVPESAYHRRERHRLTIRSEGYVQALAEAENRGAACLWVHTHPGTKSVPKPSEHDRIVDSQIEDLFRLRSGSAYYGALIVSPHSDGIAFSGYVQSEGGQCREIDRYWCVGDGLSLRLAFDSTSPQLPNLFDRNIRAFGLDIQRTLRDLRVAIVGAGGTGSAIAEQLVRLGVRHLLLIDPDQLSETNLTRVYGSFPPGVGRPKVEVLTEHLMKIAPDLDCVSLESMVNLEKTARHLISSDVVFGCTDDNAGRLVLSRLSTYMLTPVIDCGVLLSTDANGNLVGIDGRVTILSPGRGCLVCRDRIDLRRAASELLTPEERVRLEDEGYAPALGRTEPAVVAYTSLVGATAVTELLERLIGYGPEPRPTEILLRFHEREISTNIAECRSHHYCHRVMDKIGRGMTEPFLEQTWPT